MTANVVHIVYEILLYVWIIIGVWGLFNVIYHFHRGFFEACGFKLYYGFILVYKRTKKIKPLSLYRKLSYIHIPFFVLAILTFYQSMIASIFIRLGLSKGVPAQLLIPGVNITGIQLVYFIIAIAVAAAIHELMHAYTAIAHGLNVKSIGFALIFILPIAFTELDEEKLSKASTRAKVTVLAAGPSANILLALLALFLLSFIVSPYGIVVLDTLPGSLADKYGLKQGDIILEINGEPLTRSLLAKYLNNRTGVNITLKILSNNRVKTITIYKPGNVTRLGIAFTSKPVDQLINVFGLDTALAISFIITWLYLVNLGLAVINAAPLFVSDGGRIVYEVFKNKNVSHAINLFSLLILVLGVAPLK